MTKRPKIEEIVASKYMARFHCIGPACEAHCCQAWQIYIDRDNFAKVKRVMTKNPEDREHFAQRIKRKRANAGDSGKFAQIALKADGVCPFLEESGWCEIHRRFGESYLSGTCRTYPRKPAQVHNRYEMSAALSCPEIARLCLLSADGAEAESMEPSKLQQGLLILTECTDAQDPYSAYIQQIREIFLQLLQLPHYPISTKIFFIGYLANRIAPVFHNNCQQSFSEEQLAAEVDRLAAPNMLDQLHAGYSGLNAEIDLPLQIVSSMLYAKSGAGLSAQFFREILGRFPGETDERVILQEFITRRNKITTMMPERINLYLENYCKNYIFSNLYTEAPNLLTYIQGMAIRLSAFSFLLFSHPLLDALAGQTPEQLSSTEKEQNQTILDEAVVEACFKFSRAIEHDAGLWKKLNRSVEEQQLVSLAHLVQLLRFIHS